MSGAPGMPALCGGVGSLTLVALSMAELTADLAAERTSESPVEPAPLRSSGHHRGRRALAGFRRGSGS